MTRWITTLLLCLLLSPPGLQAEPRQSSYDSELAALLKQAANDADSFSDQYEATVWLTDMSYRLRKRIPDPKFRIELLKNVHYEAKRVGIEPELVLALIEVESNFKPFAISRVGARGLMQVMPFWLKKIGRPGDSLFNVRTNLRYGCTILKYYLDQEKGNLTRALGRYNGSLGRWKYPGKIYRAFDRRWYPN
ncbi:MAG: lytic transglycosylase domain-containing protein [Acidiferrobacterales bacterium]